MSSTFCTPGFTSALLIAASLQHSRISDRIDSINNGSMDLKDRTLYDAEEEDAHKQLYDFVSYQKQCPTEDQWRHRVYVSDLLDGDDTSTINEESTHDDIASVSDHPSDTSLRIFLGPQPTTIPSGWQNHLGLSTSTPQRARKASTNSEDVHLASLACSPISPAGETSQAALPSYADISGSPDASGHSPNRNSSTVFQENINRDSVTEPSVQPSSPMSQPSPTPKPYKSGSNPPVKMLSSTDVPEVASSPEANAPKDVATRTLTSVGAGIRKQEKPHLLPMRPLRLPTSSSTRVLKISNLPWSITCQALIEWLGENLQKALPPVGFQVISVHILCDRLKCRTKCPAYIEVTSHKAALDTIKHKDMQVYEGRPIRIAMASQRELIGALFPAWAEKHFSKSQGTSIITNEDLRGLVELCKLKTPFARKCSERPFMNMLSIAAKYPWQSVDPLDDQNEEQIKVLQAVRDSCKLLTLHGKHISNHTALKSLYHTFLEKHGGVSGTLRAIPVTGSSVPPDVKSFPRRSSVKRPRMSQALLDLIQSNSQDNLRDASDASGNSASDPISAQVEREDRPFQGASIKEDHVRPVNVIADQVSPHASRTIEEPKRLLEENADGSASAPPCSPYSTYVTMANGA